MSYSQDTTTPDFSVLALVRQSRDWCSSCPEGLCFVLRIRSVFCPPDLMTQSWNPLVRIMNSVQDVHHPSIETKINAAAILKQLVQPFAVDQHLPDSCLKGGENKSNSASDRAKPFAACEVLHPGFSAKPTSCSRPSAPSTPPALAEIDDRCKQGLKDCPVCLLQEPEDLWPLHSSLSQKSSNATSFRSLQPGGLICSRSLTSTRRGVY